MIQNLFNNVASGVYNKPGKKELELYKLTVQVDKQTYLNVLEEIKKQGRGPQYRFPVKGQPFPPNVYNCATFWGKTGVKLPEKTGFLENYIPAMKEQGAEKVTK